MNPVAVLGPVLEPDYSPSLGLLKRMLDGSVPACRKFAAGYVDARDVADLHLRAMSDPAAAGERVIAISGHSLWVRDIAAILHKHLGDRAHNVPTRELPLWAARGPSLVNPGVRALRPTLGKNLDATAEKAQQVLGWRPRPVEDTITESATSLLALNTEKAA